MGHTFLNGGVSYTTFKKLRQKSVMISMDNLNEIEVTVILTYIIDCSLLMLEKLSIIS